MKWSDHETNIEKLASNTHRQLHNILNIPHEHLRNFRRRTNERTIRDWERSATYHKLWKLYFKNMDELPENLLEVHWKSFSKQIWRWYKQIDTLMKGTWVISEYSMDNELLDYHNHKDLKHSEFVENTERKLFNLMKIDRDRNNLFVDYYLKTKPTLDINKKTYPVYNRPYATA